MKSYRCARNCGVKEMTEQTALFSPMVLAFLIIVFGYWIGKFRVYSFSAGLSAVLIVAVGAGMLLSVSGLSSDAAYMTSLYSSMKIFFSLGTSLFVSAVGLSAGYALSQTFKADKLLCVLSGALMTAMGFVTMFVIGRFDNKISRSALLGILCGALTSTPGMSAACEPDNVISEEVVLGYGSAYLFGVLFIIVFVQAITGNMPNRSVIKSRSTFEKPDTAIKGMGYMATVAAIGTMLGSVKIFSFGLSLGTSGGILCVGIVAGVLLQRHKPNLTLNSEVISLYRNIGLIFFFVGSGLPAGLQLQQTFHVKWLLYGIMMTCIPIFAGYISARWILKKSNLHTAIIVSGGMTSTPAIGVMADKICHEDLSDYSMVYIGALLTMVLGIRLFGGSI